jgi:hypothetical protein
MAVTRAAGNASMKTDVERRTNAANSRFQVVNRGHARVPAVQRFQVFRDCRTVMPWTQASWRNTLAQGAHLAIATTRPDHAIERDGAFTWRSRLWACTWSWQDARRSARAPRTGFFKREGETWRMKDGAAGVIGETIIRRYGSKRETARSNCGVRLAPRPRARVALDSYTR